MKARRPPGTGRGFTLVEVLVALLLLGIMTALGYGTYRQARVSAERTMESQQRTREIEFGIRTLVQDLAQAAPRPIREPLGSGRIPAMRGGGTGALLELTRMGWSNTAGAPRGTLQRVQYTLDKETLKRSYLPVLDPTLNTPPQVHDLLTRVKSFKLRFLDSNRTWIDQWPDPNTTMPQALVQRPVAVEVVVEFADWGTVRRLVEVAG
ncbi:MAG: type II secretion system minor pseudopilin GspJ [Steroidobacteraceae bacterium]